MMTTPNERYRTLQQCRRFIEELCDPGKTPKVPGAVREKARNLLKHMPYESDIESMAKQCPEYLSTQDLRS